MTEVHNLIQELVKATVKHIDASNELYHAKLKLIHDLVDAGNIHDLTFSNRFSNQIRKEVRYELDKRGSR